MFALKIIFITSALLTVGYSATQCHSDEVVEFLCQEPTCSSHVDGGLSTVRLRTNAKQPVSILGYNKNHFLIKNNKDELSIVGKRNVQTIKFANKKYWQHKVGIHKTTFEVCDSINQSSEMNHIESSNTQTKLNTDTDTTVSKTNDPVDTSRVLNDASLKIKQDNKIEDDVQNDDLDEDIDEIVMIESEDDENLVSENISENIDQNTNSKSTESYESDLNETTNQNNTSTSTSSLPLENDSSTDCTLDSCVNDANTLPKEPKENVVAEEPNDHIKITQQLPVDFAKKESKNNMPHNSNTVSPQSNHSIIGVQDANAPEELNVESFYLQKSDDLQTIQNLSSLENLNESTNNIMPQNSEAIVNLQDTNNVIKESSIEKMDQPPSSNLHFTQQLSSVEKSDDQINESIDKTMPQNSNIESIQNNYDTKEIKTDEYHQQQNEDIPQTQDLPKLEENNVPKIVINKIAPQVIDTVIDLKDNHEVMKEFNKIPLHDDISINHVQDTSNVVDQQLDENNMSSLKEENLEMKNDSDIDNILPDKTSIINDIEKQPHISNDINESKNYLHTSLNDSMNNLSNNESTTLMSNNDLVNENTTHSVLLPNSAENISLTDYRTVSNEVETTDELNKQSIEHCTSENGCSNPLDMSITPKYGYENIDHQFKPENKVPYESVHKTLESNNNNEKSKELEPQNLVSSFGHPDACSGISCLKFKRNLDKSVKSPPSTLKQVEQDLTSVSTNTELEEENKNANEESGQVDVELNFLDNFQNWLSSPTLSSFDFLWHIFGKDSTEYSEVYIDDQLLDNQNMYKHIKPNNHSELYFIVAAVITLLFSLIYYKFQKGTYENYLLTLLAAKDQNLLIVEKELSILKEQSSGNSITTTERNSEIETLNQHLTKSEEIISSQAIRIEKLEQEIEELTESGMEMHKLLSSTLESSTKYSEKFNTLKVKLVDSENLIAALTQKNFDKTKELEKKNDVIKNLQSTVDELTYKSNSLIQDNAKISLQLEQVITKHTLKESRLQSEINNLQFKLDKQTNALLTAENEIALSKDALQEMVSQKFNPTESNKFLSSIKLSAELKSAKQMCDGYKQKLDESLKSNQQYLDNIDDLKNSIVNLENKILKLEEEKQESINKLNILTKYFKEQEQEYLKQINDKALLCDNKEEESTDLVERINSLNQEIANYKSQIQSLMKEITDQEASFKIQLSAANEKASDHWILFRQTERKLKEMELETAQLRNKITMGNKKLENGANSIDSSKDFDDELLDIPLPTVSPDFTLLSLLDFEPPPPILTNQRLPPLGALGQTISPPVPLSRRHDRSLSPDSPPPPQRSSVFRPLPQRYNYMNRQNSLGHSVESLDK